MFVQLLQRKETVLEEAQTASVYVNPAKDPGLPPVDPGVRATRADSLRRVADVWHAVQRGGGTPAQRAAASLGYTWLVLLEAPELFPPEDEGPDDR